jgi:hypothetical protein
LGRKSAIRFGNPAKIPRRPELLGLDPDRHTSAAALTGSFRAAARRPIKWVKTLRSCRPGRYGQGDGAVR